MHTSLLRSRWESLFYSVLMIGGAAIVLSVAGCQSSGGGSSAQTSTKPNFGPPIQDVRTEANIVGMENDYIAAKNSQPTHHDEAVAEAARKAKEKQDKENAAKAAAAKPDAAPTPAPEPTK